MIEYREVPPPCAPDHPDAVVVAWLERPERVSRLYRCPDCGHEWWENFTPRYAMVLGQEGLRFRDCSQGFDWDERFHVEPL